MKLPKIKIVYVIESFGLGGREKVVKDLCNNVNFDIFDVYLLILSNDNNCSLEDLDKKVLVIEIPLLRKYLFGINSFLFWIFACIKTTVILKDIRPNLVHTHLFFSHLLLVSIAIKLCGCKIVHFRTVHTSGLFYRSKNLVDRIRLATEQIAVALNKTIVTAISQTIFNLNKINFNSSNTENIYIPNGIDLSIFNRNEYRHLKKEDFEILPESLVVTYVARLDVGKNHSLLLKSWSKVVNKVPSAVLFLAGDGILRGELSDDIDRYGIQNSVILKGAFRDIPGLLSISDVGVFPSCFEGFPIVLLEKMAMSLPVIVSDIDVFKEVIHHNENGIIFPLSGGDNLADPLIVLLRDAELRKHLGKNARATALKYSINNIVEEYEKKYRAAYRF